MRTGQMSDVRKLILAVVAIFALVIVLFFLRDAMFDMVGWLGNCMRDLTRCLA